MKTLSFFSGCLGLDLGLQQAGFETLLLCENDPQAAATIARNKPRIPMIADIMNHDAASILKAAKATQNDIDIIVGGPPCQTFSTAGKRASFTDPRGNAFLHFIQIIAAIRPKYFIIENVRGLLSAALAHRPHIERGAGFPPLQNEERPGSALNLVLDKLAATGYTISFNLYNTANYGVPQKRERLIIMGCLDGRKIPYLPPTHSQSGLWGLEEWVSFGNVAGDLNHDEQEYVNFPEKRLKYYAMLSAGQHWRDLPKEIIREAMGASYNAKGGKTGFYRRISWDEPSPTLVTHPAMPATDLCHPERQRPLSVEEYKRIQQFPDDYELVGTTLQKYKQIGNAVPVGFGKQIGELVMAHFHRKNLDDTKFVNFPYSRYKNTSDANWAFSVAASEKQTAFQL
ncbi:MAG: DNA cytosine methyltransferase [Parvibaculales bacterium]